MGSRAEKIMERLERYEGSRALSRQVDVSLRLGEFVYQMRTNRNLTQRELAKRAGTTQSVISRLEGGNDGHIPGFELIASLAVACGYELSVEAHPTDVTGFQELPVPSGVDGINIPLTASPAKVPT